MENKTSGKILKIVLIIVSLLLILIGLFGAFCGGLFTISFLMGNGGGYEFYILSIPSLIIGIIITYLGFKGFRKILKGKNSEEKVTDNKKFEL